MVYSSIVTLQIFVEEFALNRWWVSYIFRKASSPSQNTSTIYWAHFRCAGRLSELNGTLFLDEAATSRHELVLRWVLTRATDEGGWLTRWYLPASLRFLGFCTNPAKIKFFSPGRTKLDIANWYIFLSASDLAILAGIESKQELMNQVR